MRHAKKKINKNTIKDYKKLKKWLSLCEYSRWICVWTFQRKKIIRREKMLLLLQKMNIFLNCTVCVIHKKKKFLKRGNKTKNDFDLLCLRWLNKYCSPFRTPRCITGFIFKKTKHMYLVGMGMRVYVCVYVLKTKMYKELFMCVSTNLSSVYVYILDAFVYTHTHTHHKHTYVCRLQMYADIFTWICIQHAFLCKHMYGYTRRTLVYVSNVYSI